jgi:hypothetical protein
MTNDEQREVIAPVSFALASMGLAGFLLHDAWQIESGHVSVERYSSGRNAMLGRGIHALAEVLGWVGSVAVSAVVVAMMVAWVALAVRRVRSRRRPVRPLTARV